MAPGPPVEAAMATTSAGMSCSATTAGGCVKGAGVRAGRRASDG